MSPILAENSGVGGTALSRVVAGTPPAPGSRERCEVKDGLMLPVCFEGVGLRERRVDVRCFRSVSRQIGTAKSLSARCREHRYMHHDGMGHSEPTRQTTPISPGVSARSHSGRQREDPAEVGHCQMRTA
jgi:hypothetical protein